MGGMGLGSHGLACSGRMLKGGEGSGSARGVVEGAVRKEWVPGKATACGGGVCGNAVMERFWGCRWP